MNNLWMVAVVVLFGAGKKDAGVAVDPWDFDGLTAKVAARGDPTDELSTLALTQLGVRLEGTAVFKASAHPNTVGGVTLRIDDPADPKITCSIYATREGDGLTFKDSRCSFPLFKDQLRTTATCRRISGMAKRIKDTVAFEADAPDCTAQPMGMPMSVRATVKPL